MKSNTVRLFLSLLIVLALSLGTANGRAASKKSSTNHNRSQISHRSSLLSRKSHRSRCLHSIRRSAR
jgi:hypothetical protein